MINPKKTQNLVLDFLGYIWVLGAHGLLGRALIKACERRGLQVTGSGKEEADVCNFPQLLEQAERMNPSHIVNCAAYTDVDGAEEDVESARKVNAQGAENAALVAKALGCAFTHISTDYIFDGRADSPYTEADPGLPINAYGKSKCEGERAVLAAYPSSCIVRVSWLFGKGGRSFVSSLMHAMREKERMQGVADQKGRITYVEDAAEAILHLLGKQGVWHFANEGVVSRWEVAEYLRTELMRAGIPIACKEVLPVEASVFPTKAKRPMYSALDTDKYARECGTPPRDWKHALRDFLEA